MIRLDAKKLPAGTRWEDGPLLEAVKNDDVREVRDVLSRGLGFPNDVTWLHRHGAIHFVKSHEMLTALIEAGMTIDDTVLVEFLQKSFGDSDFSVEILQRLIDCGAPVNGSITKKRAELHRKWWPILCPLAMAAPRHLEVLLSNGANANIIYYPELLRPLHLLTIYWVNTDSPGNAPKDWQNVVYRTMCDLLLEYGADMEARSASGETPLLTAASHLCAPAIEHLARHGACLLTVDAKGHGASTLAEMRIDPKRPNLCFTIGKLNNAKRILRHCLSYYYLTNKDTGEIARRQR